MRRQRDDLCELHSNSQLLPSFLPHLRSFTFTGMSTLRPDGTVSNACKRHIRREFRELPKQTTAYDPLDMSVRDKEKRLRKAQKLYKMKASREAEMLRRSSMLVQTGVDGGRGLGGGGGGEPGEEDGSVGSLDR